MNRFKYDFNLCNYTFFGLINCHQKLKTTNFKFVGIKFKQKIIRTKIKILTI